MTRSGIRVLVIDDYADAARTLADALAMSGHEVAYALSGVEGLELAQRLRPDVVLCDIGLPGMDGLAVARALRSAVSACPRLLAALSGHSSVEDERRAKEAGFDLLLAKPTDMNELLDLLDQVGADLARPNARADVG